MALVNCLCIHLAFLVGKPKSITLCGLPSWTPTQSRVSFQRPFSVLSAESNALMVYRVGIRAPRAIWYSIDCASISKIGGGWSIGSDFAGSERNGIVEAYAVFREYLLRSGHNLYLFGEGVCGLYRLNRGEAVEMQWSTSYGSFRCSDSYIYC